MNTTSNGAKVLQITKENAQAAFAKGSESDKALISRLFPNDFGNLFERVQSFEAVLKEAGIDPVLAALLYNVLPGMDDETKHEVHARKMRLIYRVFNEGWKPDYKRGNKQAKYYPWLEITDTGIVLRYVRCTYDVTGVSPRLCAKNEAIVRHICKYFLKEYNDYLQF